MLSKLMQDLRFVIGLFFGTVSLILLFAGFWMNSSSNGEIAKNSKNVSLQESTTEKPVLGDAQTDATQASGIAGPKRTPVNLNLIAALYMGCFGISMLSMSLWANRTPLLKPRSHAVSALSSFGDPSAEELETEIGPAST